MRKNSQGVTVYPADDEAVMSDRSADSIAIERTAAYHKQCHDCGRFLPRERWVRTDDRRKAHGLCHDCYSQYDDPAFL